MLTFVSVTTCRNEPQLPRLQTALHTGLVMYVNVYVCGASYRKCDIYEDVGQTTTEE